MSQPDDNSAAELAELELTVDLAILREDIPKLWSRDVIRRLAACDSMTFGRIWTTIRVKFRADISPALYLQEIKSERDRLALAELGYSNYALRGGPDVSPKMPCGWGCGETHRIRGMVRHWSRCPKRPTDVLVNS